MKTGDVVKANQDVLCTFTHGKRAQFQLKVIIKGSKYTITEIFLDDTTLNEVCRVKEVSVPDFYFNISTFKTLKEIRREKLLELL